jgi:hypothetical protein
MERFDLDKLEEIAEGLALGFYMLMFMAVVTLLFGAAGSGFELLIAGSLAQVGRAGIEEFVSQARSSVVARQSQGAPAPRDLPHRVTRGQDDARSRSHARRVRPQPAANMARDADPEALGTGDIPRPRVKSDFGGAPTRGTAGA